jgi:hypothetical protein
MRMVEEFQAELLQSLNLGYFSPQPQIDFPIHWFCTL